MLHFVISYFVFENTVKDYEGKRLSFGSTSTDPPDINFEECYSMLLYEGKRLSFGSTSTDPPDINFEECYATLARSLIDQISFKLSKCEVTKW